MHSGMYVDVCWPKPATHSYAYWYLHMCMSLYFRYIYLHTYVKLTAEDEMGGRRFHALPGLTALTVFLTIQRATLESSEQVVCQHLMPSRSWCSTQQFLNEEQKLLGKKFSGTFLNSTFRVDIKKPRCHLRDRIWQNTIPSLSTNLLERLVARASVAASAVMIPPTYHVVCLSFFF